MAKGKNEKKTPTKEEMLNLSYSDPLLPLPGKKVKKQTAAKKQPKKR